MVRPVTAHSDPTSRPTVDIALAIPLSGPAGMFGPSCEASAELAVGDINAMGGVIDREVRLHVVDAGRPPSAVAAHIDELVTGGAVDGIVGWHLSNARNAITPFTAGRVPYVYTTFYEGGESTDGVYMVGETPQQQLFPALAWLREHRGIRRWCVVGNDYVWPRETSAHTRRHLVDAGMEFVGEAFVPLGGRDFADALATVAASEAQGVVLLMVGADAAAFNRAFARSGLDCDVIRLAMMIGEDVLYASGTTGARGLFTACGYFDSIVSPASLEFGARYRSRFGATAPALNNIGESCYEGLMLFASLAQAGRGLDVTSFDRASQGLSYAGPRGEVKMRGVHTEQPVYIAEAGDHQFDVLDELREHIS